ncbi:MAG: MFS transporter, partial [Acidobacteria bacterium]|nr:MFS transporter [Acidobacteriota bacterium]
MNEVRLWRNGVIVAYSASGLAFASWVSRIPAIRDALHLNPATIGALLLCMTLGSFASVSASGLIVVRLGTRRTIGFGSLIVGTGMLVTGFGAGVLGNPVVTGCGLAVIGVGTASWNTASNVEGAAVERALGKHIMPALHGSFSAGTVVGAGLGALAAAIHLPVVWHLGLMGLLVATSVGIATRYFRADLKESITAQPLATVVDMSADPATGPLNVIDASAPEVPGGRRLVAQAWRHPRTLLLGLLVLGLTLAEGAAGDWVALALADGHGANNATGALGYGIFVAAMTLGRFGGTPVLDRFGRVPVLRVCAAMAVAGVALFVFA